jgi:hypothetical protein
MDSDATISDYSPGDIVVDQEDSDPNLAVVVNRPPVPAEEWEVPVGDEDEEVTVADENPEYDPEAEVIIIAYHDELVESHPDWSKSEGSLRLTEAECTTYAFPPGRLRQLAPDEIGDVDANRWK